MSAKTSGAIWDLQLPHAEMLVLLAMADEANHRGGHIAASVGLLAWKAGYSERQVHRIIKDLTAAGLLVLIKSELGAANTYRINLAAGKVKPEYYDTTAEYARHTPDKMSYPPMTKRHTPPDKMTGEVRQNVRGGYDKMAIDGDKYHIESHDPTPTPTAHERTNGGDGDGFYAELRKRKVGTKKAREIATRCTDMDRVLRILDARPAEARDPQSPAFGRLLLDILDGVADGSPPPAAANDRPLTATRPNIPDTIIAPADLARQLRERNAPS